jgi:hypothetical protein
MKVKKNIHHGYRELKGGAFGKWQYIFSSEKGEVSLIELLNYFGDGVDLWEIYCLKGNLFEDVERFPTKKEAEETISKLLN